MNILARITKDSSLSILTEFIGKAIGFFLFLIIARKFGNEIFGQYSYALSFTVIFIAISDFGLTSMIIREIAIKKEKACLYISNALFIKIILSIFTIIIIIIFSNLTNKSSSVNLMIYIITINMLFKSFSDLLYSIPKSYEKIKYVVYLKIVENVFIVLFFTILILLNQTLTIIIFGFACSSLFSFLICTNLIKNKFTSFSIRADRKIIKYLVKKSSPFGISSIFLMMFFNVDTLMVSFIHGNKTTGIYAVSYTLFLASIMFTQPLTSVLFPTLSRKLVEFDNCYEKQKKLVRKVLRYSIIMILVGIIIASIYLFFTDIIIKVLYGKEFIESTESLKILALIVPFWYIYMIIGTIFSSFGKQYIFTYTLFIGIILNVTLNIVLVPIYAEIGAAIASLVTVIIMVILVTLKLILLNKTKKIIC